jgi:hypothetical protein
MKINFTGKSQNKNVFKSDIRTAVKFYANTLMSQRIVRKLDIDIIFCKLPGVIAARCSIAEDLASCPNPRKFIIEVDERLYEKPTYIALAHEMVHVEQRATGRCYDYVNNAPYVKWNKQVINSQDIDYWDSPWEIEAFGKQYGLYVRFVDHWNKKNK